uniref:Uncharacterized protein n=1 Tax=Candidatus Methanogaster sp. ANME-2c ERB4 TaxID=2759911 RepID=A0A7G9Y6R2_9EURY|nr:hypothetical protein FICJDHNH_00036 [Methanosarcinales archaeon ANME-2c ERB4]QNO43949.1 hypothetical protein AECFJODE_00002 [Methanosarcinales archaeon ANME-2c ERB4]QNO50647.1 hypothetical protein BCJHFGCD_00001 [Methanosarcinales archaeon ANME-2c ERB4]
MVLTSPPTTNDDDDDDVAPSRGGGTRIRPMIPNLSSASETPSASCLLAVYSCRLDEPVRRAVQDPPASKSPRKYAAIRLFGRFSTTSGIVILDDFGDAGTPTV